MRLHGIHNTVRELVAIRSVFPNEQALSKYLAKKLNKLGFSVEAVASEPGPGRNNLVATYGKATSYLGFYSHLDTVSPDKHYKRDPFTVWVEGKRLRGLGVADMKGGLAAILDLAEFAVSQKLPVKLVFGVDEENISVGAHDLVNAKVLADIDFLVSAESGQVRDNSQQFSACYGRRGRIAIVVNVTGKKTHAAESHKAVNAVERASVFIANLDKIAFPTNPNFGITDLVVHNIQGSVDSFSVPDECSFMLSALTTPPVKHKDVIASLTKLAKKLGVSATIKPLARPTPYGESYEVNHTNSFLKIVESQVLRPAGVKPFYSESIADENIFSHRLNIPVISIGPIGGGDHTADEWVDLSSIEKVATNYRRILELHEARS